MNEDKVLECTTRGTFGGRLNDAMYLLKAAERLCQDITEEPQHTVDLAEEIRAMLGSIESHLEAISTALE